MEVVVESNEARFYSTKGIYGFCSNFFRASIFVDGQDWMTTEHYYQAQKMTEEKYKELIRLAPNPKEAARLGRLLPYRRDWDSCKYDVMLKAVTAKFVQHPDLLLKLQATKPLYLVEYTSDSVRPDAVWGNGKAGEGLNWLGKILMEIRDGI